MRVIQLEGSFGIDHLRDRDLPIPDPGPGEVLLRMRAASLNYRDLLMIRGRYNPNQELPLIPLSDGVGVVEKLGSEVRGLSAGDRVCPHLLPLWGGGEPTRAGLRTGLGGPLPGVLSEFCLARPEHVVKAPENLDDVEASTLPCAGLTAWSALVELGAIRAGDTVLVQGTGGVAIFALQFAKLCGARVIVTSRSPDKLARAEQLGADHGILGTDAPWGELAWKWTGGRGVDHVIEVGGAGSMAQSLRAVRPGGTVSVIGVLGGTRAALDVLPILMNQVRVQGVFCGHRQGFEAMNRALVAARIQPVVDRVFPFSATGLTDALEYLESGRHFGKIALRMGD